MPKIGESYLTTYLIGVSIETFDGVKDAI